MNCTRRSQTGASNDLMTDDMFFRDLFSLNSYDTVMINQLMFLA